MASLLKAGAPPLTVPGDFYRVRSDADGFLYVAIRQDQTPSWRNLWQKSRLIVERRCNGSNDPFKDVVEAAEACHAALAQSGRQTDYWSVVHYDLEGDHR